MPDNLFNAYSLEKSSQNGDVITSGTLTTWSNLPSSSLDIGDSFRPVPNGPVLRVTKVSINDNVVGTKDGKPFRQWQISIEGNDKYTSTDSGARITYNFNFNADVHSGTMEVSNTGDAPIFTIGIGDNFRVPGIGSIPCVNVSGSDSYDENGNHIWTVIYEGSDAPDVSQENKYNFTIEGTSTEDNVQSGSISVVSQAENPHLDFRIGGKINVPGIGEVICTKINGSDAYDENGNRIWTVIYEGVSSIDEHQNDNELPKVKYSFALDKNGASSVSSGTMQVVNTGNTPALNIAVGSLFTIPGIGNVTCTKITGNDDYSDNGTHRWTVTYEGTSEDEDSSEQPQDNNIKYTFNAEKGSDDSPVYTGTKQVILFGDNPVFVHSIGGTFSIPGIGSLSCTNYNGSDEFTDDGLHKWTITYEGSNAPDDEPDDDNLPETKYSLSIEKDSDGILQKSGSMSVINSGDSPDINIQVGSVFSIPGIGNVTCTKVTGSDDYPDNGTHRWTMTYEGFINSSSDGDDTQNPNTPDTKYNFSVEKNSDGELIHSGSVEISTVSDNPPSDYQVGSTINIPGIGEVTCIKVSGSDSYTENGRRKWIMVYEASDTQDNSPSDDELGELNVKFSFDIENNSEGITVFSGSKEFSVSGENVSAGIEIGNTFNVPVAGTLTCSKIRGSKDENTGIYSFVIEGFRNGSSQGDDTHDDSGLPDNEETLSYELNGSTVRSVAGELIALRKSDTPITKKTFTLYNNSDRQYAVLGTLFRGGIALSENIVKETIRNNGVVTSSYYKHTIEIEGEGILVDDDFDDGGNSDS